MALQRLPATGWGAARPPTTRPRHDPLDADGAVGRHGHRPRPDAADHRHAGRAGPIGPAGPPSSTEPAGPDLVAAATGEAARFWFGLEAVDDARHQVSVAEHRARRARRHDEALVRAAGHLGVEPGSDARTVGDRFRAVLLDRRPDLGAMSADELAAVLAARRDLVDGDRAARRDALAALFGTATGRPRGAVVDLRA